MKYVVVILLAALLFSLMAGYDYFHSNYIILNGDVLSQDVTQLDLSNGELSEAAKLVQLKNLVHLDLQNTGITEKQYQVLAENLPNCNIVWSVPFQGQYYSNDTESLRITQLAEEDIALLSYFPNLSQIDASGCRNYTELQALEAQFPDCTVLYQVSVAGQELEHTVTALTVNNPNVSDLEAALPYLPHLQTVQFTGQLPSNEELHQLQEAYPNICFIWDFLLYEVKVSTTDSIIDLSGIPLENTQELESALPYFNNLEKVIMCDCGISNEDMDLLGQRHPEVRFVWTVSIGYYIQLRTDTTCLAPQQYNTVLSDYQTANLKYCVDMVCLDLSSNNITDVSFLAYMPHLKYLTLANTGVSDISACAGLQELEYVELFLTNVRDYSPLLSCPNLRDLNICYSTPYDGSALCQLTQLDNLYIKDWRTLPYEEALVQALSNTNIVFYTSEDISSSGSGWSDLPNYQKMYDMLSSVSINWQ